MKKGQILGQVFVFVLAVIIFGLILLYGYNAINTIGETKKDVELIQFRNDLSSSVDQVRHSYGSRKFLDLNVPANFKQICFVDLQKMLDPAQGIQSSKRIKELGNFNLRIKGEVEGGGSTKDSWKVDPNVFFVPASETPISVGLIEIDEPGFLCVNITGQVRLVLEGKGDRTYIKPRPLKAG